MKDYRAPATFEEAVYALKRSRAKNYELLGELAEVKRERNALRAALAALSIPQADRESEPASPLPSDRALSGARAKPGNSPYNFGCSPDMALPEAEAEPGNALKGVRRRFRFFFG